MTKGRADFWAPGGYNALCFECGRKRKASTLVKNWKGYWVCPDHWEPREAQDFVKGVKDLQTPPWVQPQSSLNFTLTGFWIPGDGINTADQYIPPPIIPAQQYAVGNGGSGYAVGDILNLGGGNTVVVTGVVNGVITSVSTGTIGSGALPACKLINTFDPTVSSKHLAFSNGNLTATTDQTAVYQNAASGFASTGKLYCEVTFSGNVGVWSGREVGLADSTVSLADGQVLGNTNLGYAYDHHTGNKVHGGVATAYGSTWDGGVTLGIAWDAGVGTLTFYRANVSQGTAYTGILGSYRVVVTGYGLINGTVGAIFTANFGSSAFTYTPPTGYTGWNSMCVIPATGGSGLNATISTAVYAVLSQQTAAPWLVLAPWGTTVYSTNNLYGTILSNVFQATSSATTRYCEFTIVQAPGGFTIGLAQSSFPWGTDSKYVGITSDSYGVSPGLKWNNNASTAYGSSYSAGSVIGMLFDSFTGNVSFTVNGSDLGAAFTGISGSFCPAISVEAHQGSATSITVNFGLSPWVHQPPIGSVGWFS